MDLELISCQPDNQTHSTPLLFVHGGWHAAWCWAEHFLPYFARHGYVAHAMSLRGHGSSPNHKSMRVTRIKDYAADVIQVARSIEPRPVVIGHSIGGMVVEHALAEFRAPAGVLIASVPIHIMPSVFRVMRHAPLLFLEMNLKLSLWPFVSTPERAHWLLFSDSMPEEEIKRYHSRLRDESYMVFADAALLARPDRAKVETPMLVISGGADRLFSPQQTESLARAYGTSARVFPDMAHDVMLEAGWQSVADYIIEWLGGRGYSAAEASAS
jgi:pimeloyl-ACP methyl ester carboxylesterase